MKKGVLLLLTGTTIMAVIIWYKHKRSRKHTENEIEDIGEGSTNFFSKIKDFEKRENPIGEVLALLRGNANERRFALRTLLEYSAFTKLSNTLVNKGLVHDLLLIVENCVKLEKTGLTDQDLRLVWLVIANTSMNPTIASSFLSQNALSLAKRSLEASHMSLAPCLNAIKNWSSHKVCAVQMVTDINLLISLKSITASHMQAMLAMHTRDISSLDFQTVDHSLKSINNMATVTGSMHGLCTSGWLSWIASFLASIHEFSQSHSEFVVPFIETIAYITCNCIEQSLLIHTNSNPDKIADLSLEHTPKYTYICSSPIPQDGIPCSLCIGAIGNIRKARANQGNGHANILERMDMLLEESL